MRDPAKLRLVCTMVWFDKQILISWHPEKPDYILFLHFHMQSVSCNVDQLFQFTLVRLLKTILKHHPWWILQEKKHNHSICHYSVLLLVLTLLCRCDGMFSFTAGATAFSTKWGTEPGCCWRDRNNFMQATQQF